MRGYPEIFQLGHRIVADILEGEVLVEEKIDGSQFSFCLEGGELVCKSKRKIQFVDAPDKMFAKACETVKEIGRLLHPGWTYRGEYLQKPHHNGLSYDRVPKKHIILYDIDTGVETYLPLEEKHKEAARIGLEFVPVLFRGKITELGTLQELLETISVLGGQKIEGVVIKNYNKFTSMKKTMMAKYVSEKYKEVQSAEWKKANPNKKDFLDQLISEYKTEARWNKAIQHLREDGLLTESPKDIGILLKEIKADIVRECEDEIKEKLYRHFVSKIQRGAISGFPEYYKELLAKTAF